MTLLTLMFGREASRGEKILKEGQEAGKGLTQRNKVVALSD